MKKIIILILLGFSLNGMSQTLVTAPLSRNSPTDTYPTHIDSLGKGGFMALTDTVSRDNIPMLQRKTGMVVVTNDSISWQLQGGLLNSNWVRYATNSSGVNGTDSSAIYTVVPSADSSTFKLKRLKGDTDFVIKPVYVGGGGSGQVNSDWNADSGVAQILNKPLINNAVTNGIIDPLLVTWSGTDLVFDVSAGSLIYNNVVHSVTATQITLDAADVTNPRIDAFYVDSAGNIGKITGVAQVNPVAPQVTYGQFLLTTVLVPANATTPNINLTTIYDENTEWTTSSSGTGTINFNNTVNPYHLTKAILVSSNSTGFTMTFTNPSGIDTAGIGDVFKFFLYTATQLPYGYTFQFFSGSNAVSTALSINAPGYGFSPYNYGTYQNVSIPLSAFTFFSPQYNSIKITSIGANANPVYWDYIQIQKGLYQFAPTDYSNKVDSTTISGGNEYWWAKGSQHLAGSVGGGGNTIYSGNGTIGNSTNRKLTIGTNSELNLVDASGTGLSVSSYTDKFTEIDAFDYANSSAVSSVNVSTTPISSSFFLSASNNNTYHLLLPEIEGSITTSNTPTNIKYTADEHIFLGSVFLDTTRTTYVNDTTANKPLVIGTDGNVHQSSWFGGGGGTPTLDQVTNAGNTSSIDIVINGATFGLGGGSQPYNTASGLSTLPNNTTGDFNTAIGSGALYSNVDATGNTGVGSSALYSNDGSYNTALGYEALTFNETGNYNIGLGYIAGSPVTDSSNTLYISDSTYHMYYKLDSASGTAPNVIGKDASGYWHVYQTPSGGGSIPTLYNSDGNINVERSVYINNSGLYIGDSAFNNSISVTDTATFQDVYMQSLDSGGQSSIDIASNINYGHYIRLRTIGSSGAPEIDIDGDENAITFNSNGNVYMNGQVQLNRAITLMQYLVSTLPASPTQGMTVYCTDLLSPTYLGIAVGGGAIVGIVFYNGTNWVTQ